MESNSVTVLEDVQELTEADSRKALGCYQGPGMDKLREKLKLPVEGLNPEGTRTDPEGWD